MRTIQFVQMLTIMSLSGSLNILAQTKSNNEVLQRKDSIYFQTEEARRVGDQLLLYQRDTGG